MVKIIVSSLLILISLNGFSQSKGRKDIHSLQELEVVNSNLLPVLDTVIKMKNDSESFKPAKLFTIEFDWDSIRTDLITIRARGFRLYYYYPDILGYFDYGGYTFVVKGGSLDTSIFQKSDRFHDFNFSLDSMSYINSKGIFTMDEFALSDIFAIWAVRYKQGNFKLLAFRTDNEKDKWFDNIEKEYEGE